MLQISANCITIASDVNQKSRGKYSFLPIYCPYIQFVINTRKHKSQMLAYWSIPFHFPVQAKVIFPNWFSCMFGSETKQDPAGTKTYQCLCLLFVEKMLVSYTFPDSKRQFKHLSIREVKEFRNNGNESPA